MRTAAAGVGGGGLRVGAAEEGGAIGVVEDAFLNEDAAGA